jgi:hypothetical protein
VLIAIALPVSLLALASFGSIAIAATVLFMFVLAGSWLKR